MVWVCIFCFGLILLPVAEGHVLPTSTATVVAETCGLRGAVNKLLLREGDETARLDEVGSLEGSSGGEGPARATLSLVLNWSDGTTSTPVDRCVVGFFEHDWLLSAGVRSSTKHLAPLMLGIVGELVVSELERGVCGVMGLDEVISLFVELLSHGELFKSEV